MPNMIEPYFRYYPPAPETSSWGLCVSGAGLAHIGSHQIYPPVQHPSDHYFTWEHGRVLESMQLLLISEGTGWFESKETGRIEIQSDTAFVLLPGIWHRYRPTPETGWTESWCEIRGPLVEQLMRDKVLDPEDPVRRGGLAWGLEEALDALHRHVKNSLKPGFDPHLASMAMRILAVWDEMHHPSQQAPQTLKAIATAERFIADRIAEPIDLEALAQRAGIAYSHFRRLFKNATGYSPWQYVINLRLELGRRMLAGSDSSMREISERLGFSSAFHFSAAFKKVYGTSPARWRKSMRKQAQDNAAGETT